VVVATRRAGLLIVLLVALVASAVKVLPEYVRGVVFTLGRYTGVKGPGLVFIVPVIQRLVQVDLRVVTMDVPAQDVISRDNVSVKVNAIVFFRVVEPEKAIIQVADYYAATSQLAQTTLRSVLGQHELDDMLAECDKLNHDIQALLDRATDPWGIKVANVEIKDVDLNDNKVRAIAAQAEAERNRRAKVINAEGEAQAAEKLREAAHVLSQESQAKQLRYLQTLVDVATRNTATVVVPVPIELLQSFPKKNA
jgi:regulator of protease activity HflC (stomatin/prohibitin superfamily)